VVVTFIRGATTSLAVWTVTGIVTALLRVVKDVLVAHVNAGLERVHRVTTVIGTPNVINSAAKVVKKTYVVQMALVRLASPVIGARDVINSAVMSVSRAFAVIPMAYVYLANPVIGVSDVINSAIMSVHGAHVAKLADIVHHVLMVSGETNVNSRVVVTVQRHVFS